MHTTIIEIDTALFINNLLAIAQKINRPKVKICLPVKANAYGHGLVEISKIASKYVDYFAVSCLDEGILLRQSGIVLPILVLGAFSYDEVPELIDNQLEVTVSSQHKATQLAAYCQKTSQECKVHLKIDTGMNRVGVRVSSSKSLLDHVLSLKTLKIVGAYSHFASSESDDKITQDQIIQFNEVVKHIKAINPDIICHLANSGGVCYHPDSYFDMVRPGILSYGYFPSTRVTTSALSQIKPCFSLKSKVIYNKMVDAGSGISYNHTYITKSYTRVVTIPIGYGDGYRRILSNLGDVLIGGKKYTVSGAICMDMLMVDMGADGFAVVEDEVVLIGRQKDEEITLKSVANKCQTIIYEILCGFNNRIPRLYT